METMDRGRRTSTVRQLELLIEFAEAHRPLALGRLRSKEGRALSTRLWRECSEILNTEGPARLPKEWAKVWNDMKSRVKTKITSLTLSQRGTGGGPNIVVPISALEERVADIIGRDIGPIPNVAQDQLQAPPEENQTVEVEFVEMEQHESDEDIVDDQPQLQLHLAGPSTRSPPYQSPPRPTQSPPRPTQSPSQASPPPSGRALSTLSSPRRHRHRSRQSPRQRRSLQRTSRINTQALTRQAALDESRGMVMRIEELRANTDHMLAQAALRQAEAAHAQAEAANAQAEAAVMSAHANRLRAESLATFCQALSNLVPAVQVYLRRQTSRETRRLPSSEEDE